MTSKTQLSDEERLDRYRKFVESICAHTDDYDTFCDCGQDGTHDKDCMTMNFRKDEYRCEYAEYK